MDESSSHTASTDDRMYGDSPTAADRSTATASIAKNSS
eukprot:CAMPEP_0185754534 /NCGR_PEP_ID=MMETSP1174-20130828/13180_1 /TAXON_ID=35687 /ORGANISM="Dictyocha speculum, Strain CCMP1381" /LENGTH=37 /DNA_ID= /DNA_START= /DNA_END= /DNA_ORIENTATION=